MKRCNICGSEVEGIKALEKEYNHCLNCHFIGLESKYYLSEVEEKKRYDLHNNSVKDTRYRNYFKKIIDFAFDENDLRDKENIDILDFGSGPEPVLQSVLEEIGYKDVIIYDKYYKDEETWLKKKYDIITTIEVVEHIKEPMEVFETLVKLLKPGGRLVVGTNFHIGGENLDKWWYIKDPTHISLFNLDVFKEISKRLNLEIVRENQKTIIVFRKK